MLSIVGFILTMSLLVFVHEFGHYYIARIFGVKIEEFSIGFGKELCSRIDKNGTKWKICMLPLGGFVKMYGDSDPASFDIAEVPDKTVAFYTKPLYARFLIVAAGPLSNYLFAIIIIAGFYLSFGKFEVEAIVGEVMQDSPAAMAGIRENDKIIEADGKKINNLFELQNVILVNTIQPMLLVIDRCGELIEISVTPRNNNVTTNDKKHKTNYIGIKTRNDPTHQDMNIFSSGYQAISDVVNTSNLTLKVLWQVVTNKRSSEVIQGPVNIAQASGISLSKGFLDFILFIAMLSINLGLINLLPIPILDGGHLALMIYELIARRPPNQYIKNVLFKIGIMIIFFLIVISISNDIKSLIF
jgi:regulator of sigma E protease